MQSECRPVGRTTPKVLAAQRRIVEWARWYWIQHSDRYPTQAAFSRALNVSPATLSQVFHGDREPGLELFASLAELTGIPMDTLWNRSPPTSAQLNPSTADRSRQPGRRRAAGGDE